MLFSYKILKNPTFVTLPSFIMNYWIALVIFVGIFMTKETSSFFKRMLNLAEYINESDYDAIKKRLMNLSYPEPNTGCFIWIGATYNNGYGFININKRSVSAHRLSYFVHKGIIPENFIVDHLCNNKYCINPHHLEAKSQKDNLLRSNSASTLNILKTHCDKGHEFSNENTRLNKQGSRECIACLNERKKKYYLVHTKEILEKKKQYYLNNREKIRASQNKKKNKTKINN